MNWKAKPNMMAIGGGLVSVLGAAIWQSLDVPSLVLGASAGLMVSWAFERT